MSSTPLGCFSHRQGTLTRYTDGFLICHSLSVNNLTNYGNDMTGIKAISDAMGVSGSLTSANVLANKFNDEAVALLLKVKEKKPSLITLCGVTLDQTEAVFMGWGLRPADAKLLAPEIAVRGSLACQ